MKDYKGGKSGGSLSTQGLTKKESFKPDASSPPATSTGRPKHDNSMINRHASKPKG